MISDWVRIESLSDNRGIRDDKYASTLQKRSTGIFKANPGTKNIDSDLDRDKLELGE